MRNKGDRATYTKIIGTEFIDRSCELTGDFNKVHIGTHFLGKAVLEKKLKTTKRVAHGMCIASLASTTLYKIGGDGVILGEVEATRFLRPVEAGDTITVEAEIVEKKSGGRLIVAISYKNQNGQDVIAPTRATIFVLDE